MNVWHARTTQLDLTGISVNKYHTYSSNSVVLLPNMDTLQKTYTMHAVLYDEPIVLLEAKWS